MFSISSFISVEIILGKYFGFKVNIYLYLLKLSIKDSRILNLEYYQSLEHMHLRVTNGGHIFIMNQNITNILVWVHPVLKILASD